MKRKEQSREKQAGNHLGQTGVLFKIKRKDYRTEYEELKESLKLAWGYFCNGVLYILHMLFPPHVSQRTFHLFPPMPQTVHTEGAIIL